MTSRVPPHPVGVRPGGNTYVEGAAPCIRRSSLGPFFSSLCDSIVCRVLSNCSADSLLSLALTSRALYAYTRDDDLWRALTLQTFGSRFRFSSSWRQTYALAEQMRQRESGVENHIEGPATGRPRVLRVDGVYSDVLFHKWRCATAVMQDSWLEHDNAERIDGNLVSLEEFRERFEKPGVPAIVTNVVPSWPASTCWNKDYFKEVCGSSRFVAGGFMFKMQDYLDYSDRIEGRCDQPLYLFDNQFAAKVPALALDYDTPAYFSEDLFQHLGEEKRPHYRWLIVGPRNSGSSFHKDPNATSAWNACVRGSKKWILFPPDSPPPGVHPTADESDVTAPISVVEWYMNFYDAARKEGVRVGAVECIVREGELVFVPSGWWHCVINLEWSAAITQNYVSSVNFKSVAQWLHARPEQVSGCFDDEHARYVALNFVPSVRRVRPDLAKDFVEFSKRRKRQGDDSGSALAKKQRIGLWDSLRATTSDGKPTQKQFSFGFEM